MASFQQAMTMVFAIDEINRNPNLLPNITLGYHLYDNCVKLAVAFRAATALISGTDKTASGLNCSSSPPVIGIVGDPGSTHSIAISSVLGLFRVPMVSYFATCSCLTDRHQFPSFFRTIPSDAFQVRAIVQILKRFGWTWVGLVYSNDDYGIHAAHSFHQDVQEHLGGCVAYSEMLPRDNNRRDVERIVRVIKTSTAKVVVVISTEAYLLPLMDEVSLRNVTGKQWIASEAWATSPVFLTSHLLPYLGGTLGIAIRRGEIAGLRDFLLRLRPDMQPANNMVQIFWEEMFGCRANGTACSLQGEPANPQIWKDGDIIVGGTFPFHNSWETTDLSYVVKPPPVKCTRANGTACSLQGEPANPQIWKDGDIIVGGTFPFHNSWETTDLSYVVKPPPVKCTRANGTACSLQGEPANPQIWKDGDIIVGGTFPFHNSWETTDLSYVVKPPPVKCTRANGTACSLQGEPANPQIWKDGDIIVGGTFPFHNSWETTDLSYVVKPPPVKCTRANGTACSLQGEPANPQIWKDGDIIVGGTFPFHNSWETTDLSYVVKPPPVKCTSLDMRTLQFSQSLIFAVEEINNSSSLLPGVSLGYKIYDTCRFPAQGIKMAMALVNGNENSISDEPCTKPAQVQAIIGETYSSVSVPIATSIGPFSVPIKTRPLNSMDPTAADTIHQLVSALQGVLPALQEATASQPAAATVPTASQS
ncbi:hypothetical protein KOW79_003636 [Hemibagrus wyckioides]|uniref:Receptor ligand binding region domain-containing protein n=1 Tax=Hemibagrus wyckioides TaxID=337641 RepID=A0A9D3SQH6_9TELE|nr:hypothetical protein KOW79_003636 [Hemibagrus wyckioides]